MRTTARTTSAMVIVVALAMLLGAAPALAHGRAVGRSAGRAHPAQACDTSWLGGSGDWDNPAQWSNGVPGPDTNACITAAGTYTVTSNGEQNPGAASLTLGGSSGHQTLALNQTCIQAENESMNLNDDSTITANGEIDMYGCPNSDSAGTQLQIGRGATLTNAGTITTQGTGTSTSIQGDLTNAGGSIDIGMFTYFGNGAFGSVLDNSGTINLGANVLDIFEGQAIDDTGGLITNNASTGYMEIGGGTGYVQGNGTTSPDTPNPANPAVIVSSSIQYTGTGASSIVLFDASSSLTGNLANGQNLTLQANCSDGDREDAIAEVPSDSSFTMAGEIVIDHTGDCNTGQGALQIGSGSTMTITSTGLVQTQQTTAGPEPQLTGDITSTGGTIDINTPTDYDGPGTLDVGGPLNLGANTLTVGGNGANVIDDTGGSISNGGSTGSIQEDGNYTQGDGTTTPDTANPTNPAVVVDGDITYTGTGASSIVFTDSAAGLTGNLASGQNLTLDGNCTDGEYAILYPQASFTNAGTITFTHVGGGACNGGEDQLSLAGGETMTNTGKLSAVGAATTNLDTITGTVTNPGTVSVASGDELVLSGNLTNYNSSTSILSGGTYALSGTFQYDGSGFTTSGIVYDGATIVLLGGEFEDANGANALRNVARILTGSVLAYTTAASTSGSLVNAGTLVLGGNARLSVNGTFTQTSTGTWNERPTTPTRYGVLDATGRSSLAGKLAIVTSAGFTGGNGDVLTPLVSSSRTGTFSSVTGSGAGHFTVAYTPTGFTLTVHSDTGQTRGASDTRTFTAR